jgi:uncharacterized protein YbjT (DUF2867 family)
MKIILTGATGYIGKRLLPLLVEQGHEVICCVRDKNRFNCPEELEKSVKVIEVDFLEEATLNQIPKDIDAAYYLIHSMSGTSHNYDDLERISAENFVKRMNETQVKQVIYLSGIVNEVILSKHLASRKQVEVILSKANFALTTLRAGIIVGSGSASFEIIRDLVNKLPVMITPKWLNTKCQPIAIADVLQFLTKSLLNPITYNLKRWIFTIPVMTPKLSSYWLYFVTSTSYRLASALVSSMKVEVICRDNRVNELLQVYPISYLDAVSRALVKVEENNIVSSWKDSLISGRFDANISEFIKIPKKNCFVDQRKMEIENYDFTIERIWSLGGETGWYYGDWLWDLRGFIDKLYGGVGSRRGRTNQHNIHAGDVLDFWRVLYADKEEGKLLLFAEMKLPGNAWLEFKIVNNVLYQTATYEPLGIWGKWYWYAVLPFHGFIFNGMLQKLIRE